MYGDVHRVKIMFNKKENALVQMADANQAQLGTNDNNDNPPPFVYEIFYKIDL